MSSGLELIPTAVPTSCRNNGNEHEADDTEEFVDEEVVDSEEEEEEAEYLDGEPLEPDDLVSEIHASLLAYRSSHTQLSSDKRTLPANNAAAAAKNSYDDQNNSHDTELELELVHDHDHGHTVRTDVGNYDDDDDDDDAEYEEQIIEQWFRRDQLPDDLESACRTLIGIVYKGEDVDPDTMMRRSPLPELYRYLRQHYDYKVHTDQVDHQQVQAERQQKSLHDIFKKRESPAQAETPPSARSDNLAGRSLQSCHPEQSPTFESSQVNEEIIINNNNNNNNNDDGDDNGDDGDHQKHSSCHDLSYQDSGMVDEELVEEEEDDDEDIEVFDDTLSEETSVLDGNDATLGSSDHQSHPSRRHVPLDSQSFDTDSGPEILLAPSPGDDTTVSTFHNSTDDAFGIVDDSLNDTDRRSRAKSKVLRRENSQSSPLLQEILTSVVPGVISVSETDPSIAMDLDFDDQIVQSWLDENANEPDDHEKACRQLIPIIYRGISVDPDVMVKRMPVRELYKYLKQHYWFVVHRSGLDDYNSQKTAENGPGKPLTVPEETNDSPRDTGSTEERVNGDVSCDLSDSPANDNVSDSSEGEADVTLTGAAGQGIHVVLRSPDESDHDKNRIVDSEGCTVNDDTGETVGEGTRVGTEADDDTDVIKTLQQNMEELHVEDDSGESAQFEQSIATLEEQIVDGDEDGESIYEEDVIDGDERDNEEIVEGRSGDHGVWLDSDEGMVQKKPSNEVDDTEDANADYTYRDDDDDEYVEEEILEDEEEEGEYGAEELLSDLRADLLAYRSQNY